MTKNSPPLDIINESSGQQAPLKKNTESSEDFPMFADVLKNAYIDANGEQCSSEAELMELEKVADAAREKVLRVWTEKGMAGKDSDKYFKMCADAAKREMEKAGGGSKTPGASIGTPKVNAAPAPEAAVVQKPAKEFVPQNTNNGALTEDIAERDSSASQTATAITPPVSPVKTTSQTATGSLPETSDDEHESREFDPEKWKGSGLSAKDAYQKYVEKVSREAESVIEELGSLGATDTQKQENERVVRGVRDHVIDSARSQGPIQFTKYLKLDREYQLIRSGRSIQTPAQQEPPAVVLQEGGDGKPLKDFSALAVLRDTLRPLSATHEPPPAIEAVSGEVPLADSLKADPISPEDFDRISPEKAAVEKLNAIKVEIDAQWEIVRANREAIKEKGADKKAIKKAIENAEGKIDTLHNRAINVALNIVDDAVLLELVKPADVTATKLYKSKIPKKISGEERKKLEAGPLKEVADAHFEGVRRKDAFVKLLTARGVGEDAAADLYQEWLDRAGYAVWLRGELEGEKTEKEKAKILRDPYAIKVLQWEGIKASEPELVLAELAPIVEEYNTIPPREERPKREASGKAEKKRPVEKLFDSIDAGQEIPDKVLKSFIKDERTSPEDKARLEAELARREEKRGEKLPSHREHVLEVVREGHGATVPWEVLEKYSKEPEIANFIKAAEMALTPFPVTIAPDNFGVLLFHTWKNKIPEGVQIGTASGGNTSVPVEEADKDESPTGETLQGAWLDLDSFEKQCSVSGVGVNKDSMSDHCRVYINFDVDKNPDNAGLHAWGKGNNDYAPLFRLLLGEKYKNVKVRRNGKKISLRFSDERIELPAKTKTKIVFVGEPSDSSNSLSGIIPESAEHVKSLKDNNMKGEGTPVEEVHADGVATPAESAPAANLEAQNKNPWHPFFGSEATARQSELREIFEPAFNPPQEIFNRLWYLEWDAEQKFASGDEPGLAAARDAIRVFLDEQRAIESAKKNASRPAGGDVQELRDALGTNNTPPEPDPGESAVFGSTPKSWDPNANASDAETTGATKLEQTPTQSGTSGFSKALRWLGKSESEKNSIIERFKDSFRDDETYSMRTSEGTLKKGVLMYVSGDGTAKMFTREDGKTHSCELEELMELNPEVLAPATSGSPALLTKEEETAKTKRLKQLAEYQARWDAKTETEKKEITESCKTSFRASDTYLTRRTDGTIEPWMLVAIREDGSASMAYRDEIYPATPSDGEWTTKKVPLEELMELNPTAIVGMDRKNMPDLPTLSDEVDPALAATATPISDGMLIGKDGRPLFVSHAGEAAPLERTVMEQFGKKFGIQEGDLQSIEAFRGLSVGQQLLVLKNLEQVALTDVKEEAQTQQKEEWGKTPWYKKAWKQLYSAGMNPEHRIAELEKEILAKHRGGADDDPARAKILAENLSNVEQLAKVAAKGPEVNVTPEGELEMAYFSSVGSWYTPEQKERIEQFNRVASEFSKLPHEWGYETEDSRGAIAKAFDNSANAFGLERINPTNRRRYEIAKARYARARASMLNLSRERIDVLSAGDPTKKEELEKSSLRSMNEVDERVQLNQLFNNHPDAEKALQQVEDQNTILAAAKEFWKSKGMFVAGGALARWGTIAISGGIMLPALGVIGAIGGIGAGVGGAIGAVEGKKLMKAKRTKGRMSEEDMREEIEFETYEMNPDGSTKFDAKGNRILKGNGKRQIKEFTDATFFTDRIDRLSEKLSNTAEPAERAFLEKKIAQTTALMSERFKRGMINFGGSSLEEGDERKGNTIANRLSFIQALAKGQLNTSLDHAALDAEIERITGLRQSTIEDKRKQDIRKTAAKSALIRGAFALTGAGIAQGIKEMVHFGGGGPLSGSAEHLSPNRGINDLPNDLVLSGRGGEAKTFEDYMPTNDAYRAPLDPKTVDLLNEDQAGSIAEENPDAYDPEAFSPANYDKNIPSRIGRDISPEELAALRSTGFGNASAPANMEQHNQLIMDMKKSGTPLTHEQIQSVLNAENAKGMTQEQLEAKIAEMRTAGLTKEQIDDQIAKAAGSDGTARSPGAQSRVDTGADAAKESAGTTRGIDVGEGNAPDTASYVESASVKSVPMAGVGSNELAGYPPYTVVSGDNLTKILKANIPELNSYDLSPQGQENAIQNLLKSLSPEELKAIGLGSNPNKLAVGQTLNLNKVIELLHEKKIGGVDLIERAQHLVEKSPVSAGAEQFNPDQVKAVGDAIRNAPNTAQINGVVVPNDVVMSGREAEIKAFEEYMTDTNPAHRAQLLEVIGKTKEQMDTEIAGLLAKGHVVQEVIPRPAGTPLSMEETVNTWKNLPEAMKLPQAQLEAGRYLNADIEKLFPKPPFVPISQEWLSLRDQGALSIIETDPRTLSGSGDSFKGYDWPTVAKIQQYMNEQGITKEKGYMPIEKETLADFLKRALAEKVLRDGPSRPFAQGYIHR